MPALLRDRPDDLRVLVELTAQARAINNVFVEKDFWVTETLRAATAPIEIDSRDGLQHRVRAIFKGGTSLSRIYGLIERFSEDVDLLIGFPPVDASVGAKDRVLKRIRDNVGAHLRLGPADIRAEGASTKGVKRNTRYHYPRAYRGHSAVSGGVLLEMGCRGGTFPTQTHAMRSMLAEHAIDELGDTADTWQEFAAFDVEVLAPERTLMEKLGMLHDAATNIADDVYRARLLKAGRHLYDVHQLLNAEQVLDALRVAGPGGVGALCDDIYEHSVEAGFPCTRRPAAGYGQSPLVQPAAGCREVLEAAYEASAELVYGSRPTLDECLDAIRGSATLL
ncbi:nucleotidyl transferase AbiEii/AbiGii toxin family protein [Mycolicibacterium senegalense]|uniref:nucleotidyl transferase AbiEii/AbiGii toxin family protein n=1 Tax=Mycolicibacterium senegalense TaxID=1796 RepID=UPI003AAC3E13